MNYKLQNISIAHIVHINFILTNWNLKPKTYSEFQKFEYDSIYLNIQWEFYFHGSFYYIYMFGT